MLTLSKRYIKINKKVLESYYDKDKLVKLEIDNESRVIKLKTNSFYTIVDII